MFVDELSGFIGLFGKERKNETAINSTVFGRLPVNNAEKLPDFASFEFLTEEYFLGKATLLHTYNATKFKLIIGCSAYFRFKAKMKRIFNRFEAKEMVRLNFLNS